MKAYSLQVWQCVLLIKSQPPMKDDIGMMKALSTHCFLIKATSNFNYSRRVAFSLYVSCKTNL